MINNLNIFDIIVIILFLICLVYILTRVISFAIIKSINQGYIEKWKEIIKLLSKKGQ